MNMEEKKFDLAKVLNGEEVIKAGAANEPRYKFVEISKSNLYVKTGVELKFTSDRGVFLYTDVFGNAPFYGQMVMAGEKLVKKTVYLNLYGAESKQTSLQGKFFITENQHLSDTCANSDVTVKSVPVTLELTEEKWREFQL